MACPFVFDCNSKLQLLHVSGRVNLSVESFFCISSDIAIYCGLNPLEIIFGEQLSDF